MSKNNSSDDLIEAIPPTKPFIAGPARLQRPNTPITIPFIALSIFDFGLMFLGYSVVPDYCITRYHTGYFLIAAGICAMLSIVVAISKSALLRLALTIIAPVALLYFWNYPLNYWAGGDDGPGFGWGIAVGGATLLVSAVHAIVFICQLIRIRSVGKE